MNKTLTRQTKTQSGADKKISWFIMDAKGEILGRLATKAARIVMGKGKPTYTPGQDAGDHLIIINASDVAVTGRKESDKHYYHHSGYPGGLKDANLAKLRSTFPDRIVREAIKGMLPKNRAGSLMIKKLHIYAGSEHEFADRSPVEVTNG